MIKAVIFDFGLVISKPRPREIFRSYEQDLGLVPDSINTIMFDSEAWPLALRGKLTMQKFWQKIGPSLNLKGNEEITAFQTRYYQDEQIELQTLALIQRLHGTYQLAVLSNHPPGLNSWLIDWQIRRYFEIVYCSGDEGFVKPESKAYQETLRRLNVEPHQSIFIDDTPGHVEAALQLGMKGVVFHDATQCERDLDKILARDGRD